VLLEILVIVWVAVMTLIVVRRILRKLVRWSGRDEDESDRCDE
jgi:hypothetical protein